MLKHKLIGVIAGVILITGIIVGTGIVKTNKNQVTNNILLSAVNNNIDKAVVINTNKSPLVLYKDTDSSSSSSSSVLSYISVGEMLNVESLGSNFYKVQVEETGVVGYISVNNLQIISSGVNDSYSNINKEGSIINVDSSVHLRGNATMDSNILANLKNNTNINILGKQGSWYKVSIDGEIGFLYQSYVGVSNNSINENNNKNTKNSIDNSNKNNNQSNNVNRVNTSINNKKMINNNSNIVNKKNISSNINNIDNNKINKQENIQKPVGRNIKTDNITGSISYIIPKASSYIGGRIAYPVDSILVRNTTNKDISANKLNEYMRSWIMIGQNNCADICDATGTLWGKEWLDKVPNEVLVQAFINANGKEALSKDITANEFIKATQELDRLTAQDVPFTLKQATKIIEGMMEKDGYASPSQIVKVVFTPSNHKGWSGYYSVYTKESMKSNSSDWTVFANTGYAHG